MAWRRNRLIWVGLVAGSIGACANWGGNPGPMALHGEDDKAPMSTPSDDDVGTPDMTPDRATAPDAAMPVDAATPADAATPVDAAMPPTGDHCDDAIPLVDGVTLHGEMLPTDGVPSTACRPSNAPQRFFSYDLPAGARSVIRVAPTFSAVVRVLMFCDATSCITDDQSDGPGSAVTLTIDSPGDHTLHKIVTVSGLSADDSGSFDITLTLTPGSSMGGDDGGTTMPDAGETDGGTMRTDAGADATVDAGSGSTAAPPRLVAPLSTSHVTSAEPTFRWQLAAGTNGAMVEICADRDCTIHEATIGTLGASATPSSPLRPGVHFWRAFGSDTIGTGTVPSPTWEFVVGHRSAAVSTSWGTMPDYDGNGAPDLAVEGDDQSSAMAPSYTFIYTNGGSTLPATPSRTFTWPLHNLQRPIDVGDVNGDGFGDLAILASTGTSSTVSVYFGSSVGLPATPDEMIASATILTAAAGVGDVDGDGYADFAAALRGDPQNGWIVYHGGPAGLDTTPSEMHTELSLSPANFDPSFIFGAGDVNGDGYDDVAVTFHNADAEDSAVIVYSGSAGGVMSSGQSLGVFGDWPGVTATDANGDGYADLAIAWRIGSPLHPRISLFEGSATGIGSISASDVDLVGGAPDIGTLLTGDINGDGFDDVAALSLVNSGSDFDTWIVPGGARGWGTPVDVSLTAPIHGQRIGIIGDIDRDGFDDLVAAHQLSGSDRVIHQFDGSAAGLMSTPVATLTWPNNQAASTTPVYITQIASGY